MGTQTKTMQKRVLDAARQRGELSTLAWFIEVRIGAVEYAGAPWPGALVPVVAVGDDPEISRQWAEVLAELFKAANRTNEFAIALTTWDLLESTGVRWYEWGERSFDIVCEGCGAIGDSCICKLPGER